MFISNRLFHIWQDLTVKANELTSQGQGPLAQGYYLEAFNNAKHLFDLSLEGADMVSSEAAPALVVSSLNLSGSLRALAAPGEAMAPTLEAMSLLRAALGSELVSKTFKEQAAEHMGQLLDHLSSFYGILPALDKIVAHEIEKTQAAIISFSTDSQ